MSNQIFELQRDVAAKLKERKFPFRVTYGPERMSRENMTTHIVFERDRAGTDLVQPPQGQQRNPRKMYTRKLGVMITVYAQTTQKKGAMTHEHEELCDQIVDALVVALDDWCTEGKAGEPEYVEMRYLSAQELNDLESWPGVVYVLRLRVARGVFAKDFTGQAKPEATVNGFSNQTQARLTGAPDEDPEIGCGA